MRRVVVIGGGASGLMAAAAAAKAGCAVTLLEAQSKCGSKLLRTGNGRCNFTNTADSAGHYHGAEPSFADQVLEGFSVQQTMQFFESIGIFSYHADNDSWIYPHSEQAGSVLNALLFELQRQKVKCKLSEKALCVKKNKDGFVVETQTWHYEADRVILCCGTTASLMAKEEQEVYIPKLPVRLDKSAYRPALTYLTTDEKDAKKWAGVRARGLASLIVDGKSVRSEYGQVQFTANGISGIAVFNLSTFAIDALLQKKSPFIEIDLAPDYTEAQLRQKLSALQEHKGSSDAAALLAGLVPDKLISFIKRRVSAKQDLAFVIKHFSVHITGSGSLSASQVASGGVLTSQLDPHTMMLRLCEGIFICGEMIDIDASCGGWNLQFAWSSGYLAGMAAAKENADF